MDSREDQANNGKQWTSSNVFKKCKMRTAGGRDNWGRGGRQIEESTNAFPTLLFMAVERVWKEKDISNIPFKETKFFSFFGNNDLRKLCFT